MKALSLWQPHVAAIALELKPWETRSAAHWATSYRGPLALHAAKRVWNDADEWHGEAGKLMGERVADLIAERFPDLLGTDRALEVGKLVMARVMVYGAVVCTADLVDCVSTSKLRGKIPAEHEFWGDFSDGEDGRGRVAFKLENVRVLAQPLAWRGMQGWFDVDLGGEPQPEIPAPAEEQLSLFGGL